ncbi:3'-5' exoribonuclease [Xanthomonas hortorum pv. pelargonii]|uniref:3'-5' exoribonuclease n=1 Tax=Xanthomonas hortorum TaxID=56454 RepID=UPI0021CA5DFE|nr:3'-5' exoribonuclease [Xanthomonas hortorum]MCU1706798.1 3'-5' exoribonuclease [Xanthomonas hortorum pv. pelargonii]MCU1715361.1 3'-5' exoribonuclease [Xanthomonas hortorum pv. pelargonii]UXN02119.1 3'-5' exoribonuclease [Xanthomonas hortorum pv. pelargonii]UXN02152.1 3'-5' exoribonuclease [Xanthomonas hortorum pv. pelargonii]
MRFFLDTEWADPVGSELVSIGLVSEDSHHRFYAERDPLPAMPTDFVRHVVYPLLQGRPASMSEMAMTTGLRAFLGADQTPLVLADYAHDLVLLRYVLDGFDMPDDQAQACGPNPQVQGLLIDGGQIDRKVEWLFENRPMLRARRHHALNDAEVLRLAWELCRTEVLKRVDP